MRIVIIGMESETPGDMTSDMRDKIEYILYANSSSPKCRNYCGAVYNHIGLCGRARRIWRE